LALRYSPTLILIPLALIASLIIVSRADNGGPLTDRLTGEQTIDSVVVVTLNELGAFVVSPVGEESARFDHGRTAVGLRRLAAALDAVTLRGVPDTGGVGAVPAGLLDASDLLEGATNASTHPNIAREAFLLAADAVSRLQLDRYAHLERAAGEMREAAAALRPDRPLLDQGEAVQRFFERAYDVLRAM
jgi:hypothetical protein